MKRGRGDDQSDGQDSKKRMQDVPQIELERQERMARNKEMMEQLQLQEHAARLQDLSKVRGLTLTMATNWLLCAPHCVPGLVKTSYVACSGLHIHMRNKNCEAAGG